MAILGAWASIAQPANLPIAYPAEEAAPQPAPICWVEQLPAATAASAPVARHRSPARVSKAHKAAKVQRHRPQARAAAHRRQRRSSPSILVPRPAGGPFLRWNCAPISIAPWRLDPFSSDFADIMFPFPSDRDAQQWIIDRATPRRRRFPGRHASDMPVVSTAPEISTWLMMIAGFGLIGHSLRSRIRGRLGTTTHSRHPLPGSIPISD